MIDPELRQKFLDELRERPNISVTAKRLNISKATIYRWRDEDKEFALSLKEALGTGREGITDLAESKLIAAIQRGERWAIQTWLEAHEKRFYKPRKAMPAPPTQRVITTMQLQVVNSDGSYKDDKGVWRNHADNNAAIKPELPLVHIRKPSNPSP